MRPRDAMSVIKILYTKRCFVGGMTCLVTVSVTIGLRLRFPSYASACAKKNMIQNVDVPCRYVSPNDSVPTLCVAATMMQSMEIRNASVVLF